MSQKESRESECRNRLSEIQSRETEKESPLSQKDSADTPGTSPPTEEGVHERHENHENREKKKRSAKYAKGREKRGRKGAVVSEAFAGDGARGSDCARSPENPSPFSRPFAYFADTLPSLPFRGFRAFRGPPQSRRGGWRNAVRTAHTSSTPATRSSARCCRVASVE